MEPPGDIADHADRGPRATPVNPGRIPQRSGTRVLMIDPAVHWWRPSGGHWRRHAGASVGSGSLSHKKNPHGGMSMLFGCRKGRIPKSIKLPSRNIVRPRVEHVSLM